MTDVTIVLCNAPDIDTAEKIAERLVQSHLAACVNILFPCKSIYHWNNGVQKSQEIPMIIKTVTTLYPQLEAMILELHPYEIPEILALDTTDGLPGYCDWVEQSVYVD